MHAVLSSVWGKEGRGRGGAGKREEGERGENGGWGERGGREGGGRREGEVDSVAEHIFSNSPNSSFTGCEGKITVVITASFPGPRCS